MIIFGWVKGQSGRVDVLLADNGVQSGDLLQRGIRGWLRREVGSIGPTYKCGERFTADIEDYKKTHYAE